MELGPQPATALCATDSVFVISTHTTVTPFDIDHDAFADWGDAEGAGLLDHLPAPGDASPGSTLSELVYRALSAQVLLGDPGIELNIHGHADGAGYLVQLNNRAGSQLVVGMTKGRHELRWPPIDLAPIDKALHYLQEVCRSANALLADLLVSTT